MGLLAQLTGDAAPEPGWPSISHAYTPLAGKLTSKFMANMRRKLTPPLAGRAAGAKTAAALYTS